MHPKIDEVVVFLEQSTFFRGIKDKAVFAEKMYQAYPMRELVHELKRMEFWLVANPVRQKKNYARFITNWLSRNKRGEK